jgi:hypothetical protein
MKGKKLSKALSLILAVLMVFVLFPVGVRADTHETRSM